MSRRGTGIATKVALLLSGIVIMSSSAVGLTMYWRFSRALVEQELRELSSLARNKSARFVAQIDALRADALFVSQTPVVQRTIRAAHSGGIDPDSQEVEQQLKQRMKLFFSELLDAKPQYSQVRLIGVEASGREIVRVERTKSGGDIRVVPDHELQAKGDEPYFAATLRLAKDKVYLSDVNLNREHGRVAEPRTPVVRAACPVYGPAGKPAAILVINRFVQPLIEMLSTGVQPGHTLLLANDQGEYLAHPDASRTFAFDIGQSSRIQDDFPALADALRTQNQEAAAEVDDSAEGRRMAIGLYKAQIDPSNPARFVAFALLAPYELVVAESARSGRQSLWISALLLVASIGLGYVLSRSVTGPLRQIAAAAEAFGRGDSHVELPSAARDETGIVARALQSMMGQIRDSHEKVQLRANELEASRAAAVNLLHDVEAARRAAVAAEQATRNQAARTQAILEGATDAIITISADGTIESFNAAAERMFGYAARDVIGQNVKLLMPSPYREEHDQYIRNYLTTGVSKIIGIGREVAGRRADGTTFPVDLAVSEVRLNDRRLFTGMIHDVSERKLAMEQLTSANCELAQRAKAIERVNQLLARSNEDLKQFAYVASHDLQEPLRKVVAFCQMLQDEYKDRLDDQARKYIQYAVDGATRMKALVQDLLAYSRVETQGRPLEPTDAHHACNEAIENLAAAVEESAAEIRCDPLPMILADRAQLVRLFQNLIGNAIKYRRDQPPKIRVSAESADGEWVFRVQDNGIGIDPQYYERIFLIFQRLHARHEYSGTGIGLAVCKRIVERLGGRIWVESQPGVGSEFSFAVPRPTPDLRRPEKGEPSDDHVDAEVAATAG